MAESVPPHPLRSLGWRLVLGAGLGLVLFAGESWLLLRSGLVGVDINVDGPYAALSAAVRPILPGLLLRVAAVYVVAGVVLAGVAWGLGRIWGRGGVGVTVLGWCALALLLAWDRAIARPALFDDLPSVRPLLAWLVDHGAPWHPRAAAGVLALVHVAALLARLPTWTRRVQVGTGLLASVAVLLVAERMEDGGTEDAKPPLVVLIGIDAFRPDRLLTLGGTGEVAPHVDRFVADSTLFTRAYTPVAQTEPAWRSLLTARWPHETGVRYALTSESRMKLQPTFPESFARAGWRTVFATDCSRFHAEGPSSGFATRLQPPRGAVNFLLEKLRYRALGVFADHSVGAAWVPEFIDNRALAGIHDPMGYAERLTSTLLEEASQGPTLFAFHATAAHFPGDPVHPFYRRFVAPSEPLERRLRMHFAPVSPGAKGGWSRDGAEALYDELIAQADAQVGMLLDALRRSGRYDDALVRLVDVGPTLLELSSLPALTGVAGVSLAPLLRGESPPPLNLYAETGFTHVSPEVFDAGHWPGAPRAFDAYRIRPDGVVELGDAAHEAVVLEKDRGAFDGERWWVDRPQADGTLLRVCSGDCEGLDALSLESWLDTVRGRTPEGDSRKVAGHVDDSRRPVSPGTVRPPQQLLRLRPGQHPGPAHPQPRGG